MHLLLTGATGVAGLAVYRAALADPAITHITLLTRRLFPAWTAAELPPNAPVKTTVLLHSDFLAYPPDIMRVLGCADACVWALGRNALGMREEAYTEVTWAYAMAAVMALCEAGVGMGRAAGSEFRFVFVSAEGTDSEVMGRPGRMWATVKRKTELDLAAFCANSVGMKAHILRLGYFFPSSKYAEVRRNPRDLPLQCTDCIMAPLLSFMAPTLSTPRHDLAWCAVELAKGRWPDKALVRSEEITQLTKKL
ncbi:uncharacterized protein FIBRA_00329 [Fibroporia radiculosa]|uniref:NAD-dependent epimerase/dehydratase domain-containing protein n=1 Tax=Fibroporia radiculosa TaxID=599839 RepID=J7RVD6_9APHY|nr:uncharacterized protein FIBRA_00329 [Fibroporia radiculosa]CCL98335.1 predicted protein [Fibroporia radiculosa]